MNIPTSVKNLEILCLFVDVVGVVDMTKEDKKELYRPKRWALYCNGDFVCTYESHAAAKRAKYFKNKEADENWADETYTIKRYEK